MRPLNVAHFDNAKARGGAEEHILTLLRGLDRTRFRPLLVCTPETAAKLGADVPADVTVVPLRAHSVRDLRPAFHLARVLREHRVDILHSHLFYSSLFASPVGRLCRVPVIVETPHVRERWRRSRLKTSYVVDRLAGRLVDRFIAVSRANARYLVDEKALPAAKVVVIENGCDLKRFSLGREPDPDLRQSLGFRPEDRALIVIGRLEPQKGHSVLLQALPLVRREFPHVRLVCVGEGAERRALEAQAASLQLKEVVRFVGYRSDVEAWLSIADVMVLPSFYEGLPLVAIEALAARTPVVATAVDGTPEVVVHGKTGLTVPAGDPRALAEAVTRLLREPEWARQLAIAGRRWVEERFSEQRQVRLTEKLYLEAWDSRRRKGGRDSSASAAEQPPAALAS
jgi:glycosyltransferase involved in cell wall biosynthesis